LRTAFCAPFLPWQVHLVAVSFPSPAHLRRFFRNNRRRSIKFFQKSTLLAEFPADAHIGKQTREIFMSDNRNGGLPPFFPRAQDGSMAHAFNLDASSGHFSFFEGSAKIAAIVGGLKRHFRFLKPPLFLACFCKR
jgi:hypothetical protein